MSTTLADLATELEREYATLQIELTEIEMLLRQATTEAERLEARRAQAEERVVTLERASDDSAEVVDARRQLIAETRRSTLMAAQVDVLAGKQRALARFSDRLAQTLPQVRDAAGAAGGAGAAAPVGESNPVNDRGHTARDVLEAQEQLRRDITRRMHDGPAQSIANIALQAQVVKRLMERQPKQAQAELNELVRMVESALEQTKGFIFEVRPMVLDDLGLVPTLRRATLERSRRSGLAVRFESVGADRRLPSELESSFFRVIDDALVGYLGGHPQEVSVVLDWTDGAVRGTVQARTGGDMQSADARAKAVVAAARHEKTLPAALASMIRETEQETALRATGLTEEVWQEVSERAAAAGLSVTLSEDRSTFEVVASSRH